MTAKVFLNQTANIEPVAPKYIPIFDGLTHTSVIINTTSITQIITFDAGRLITPNFFAIQGHNFRDLDITALQLRSHPDDGFGSPATVLMQITPGEIATGINFVETPENENQVQYLSVLIQNATPFSDSNGLLTNVSIGEKLELPNEIQPNYTPPPLAINADVKNNISMGGNFIGRSVRLEQYDFTIKQAHLTPDWVRANWLTLLDYIQEKPFFYLWNDDHPEDMVYCWTKGDIPPPVYNHQCYMSFLFKCNGFIERG